MKRQYSLISNYTDNETQATLYSQEEMPRKYAKVSKYGRAAYRKSNYAGTLAKVPRAMSSNTCIIPLIVNVNTTLSADIARGFGFTTGYLWINQVSDTAIPGAVELATVFDLMRIVKVECVYLPGNNQLDYDSSTGRNIPYLYNAFDANSGETPTLSTIQQLSSCKVQMGDKMVKRTIYPKLNDDNVIQVRDRDQFVLAGDNTIPWYGWKFYADLQSVVNVDSAARFSFKIFYECRSSK